MQNGDKIERLTEREKTCLRHWLQHKSAKEIAVELGISYHAVEKRLKMARTKLDVASSLEAAKLLAAAEGSDQTVPQTPDLSANPDLKQGQGPQSRTIGALIMIALAIAGLAVFLQPPLTPTRESETTLLVEEYDQQLEATLATMISSAEIDENGEIFFARPIGDPRYLQPRSGRYWQVSGGTKGALTSRSLFDRMIKLANTAPLGETLFYDSNQFESEPLRIAQRTVRLPGSNVDWQFVAARAR